MSDLLRALTAMRGDDDERKTAKIAPDIEAIKLRDALASLNAKHEFRPGMIVRQKPAARIYKPYGDNDLAIVVAILDEPIIGGDEAGSPYFRTIVDMTIGSVENTGTDENFCVFHVELRRFEPVPESEIALRLAAAS